MTGIFGSRATPILPEIWGAESAHSAFPPTSVRTNHVKIDRINFAPKTPLDRYSLSRAGLGIATIATVVLSRATDGFSAIGERCSERVSGTAAGTMVQHG
jgi:hypothetical protein